MKKPLCKNCFYWGKIRGKNVMRGVCHRLPPQFIASQVILSIDETVRKNSPNWADTNAITGVFPLLWEFEWCGEYVDKNKKRGE